MTDDGDLARPVPVAEHKDKEIPKKNLAAILRYCRDVASSSHAGPLLIPCLVDAVEAALSQHSAVVLSNGWSVVCGACVEEGETGYIAVDWPCPTVRAIGGALTGDETADDKAELDELRAEVERLRTELDGAHCGAVYTERQAAKR